MVIRKTVSIYRLLPVLLLTVLQTAPAQVFEINEEISNLTWEAEKVTGRHNGGLKIESGTVEITGDRILKAVVVADLTTIQDFDLESDVYRAKLENHLKSNDFFQVDSFPRAIFTLGSARPEGAGKYRITGALEIKGMVKPVEFIADVVLGKQQATASGSITLDRTQWDIRYRSASFFQNLGDRMIYDNFKVGFMLVAEPSGG